MVAAEIAMGFQGFNALLNGAKALKGMNDAALRNAAVIELQEQILAAMAEQSSLIETVRELKAEIVKHETWEAEKQRYQLDKLPPGVFVYTLKAGMENGEPPHQLCEPCYQKGRKSILHATHQSGGTHHLKCAACGADFRVGWPNKWPSQAHGTGSDWPG